MTKKCLIFLFAILVQNVDGKQMYLDDICGHITGQRVYLEYGECGTLEAQYENNLVENFTRKLNKSDINSENSQQKRCTIEFITCPFCVIGVSFKFLNISRNCRKSMVFDNCGCDYIWIYEPSYEQVSGEQFCGFFTRSNMSNLEYTSQTRKLAVTFFYNSHPYGLAFSLDYYSRRNRIFITGSPTPGNVNNASQFVTSPFFPNYYPKDINIEHVINCNSVIICRISLVFTDFQVAHGSIIEFFDWNGQRIYVATGNVFRPPVITSSGPSLVVRFYGNGAAYMGYKAAYTFLLGEVNETQFKPNIDCGGHVNNLGGAITMMNMVSEGTKFFDCAWIIKPPESYLHLKTHLYVKLVQFSNLVGNSEITIHQGLISTGPMVEHLRLPLANFYIFKQREHVVPISQGFYIGLRGLFRPESHLAIVYAAFNYKDCYAGSDFLCHNLRCISVLLNCDGFDHCGDNSDELSISCSKDPRDRRQWSNTPNFLFPKVDGYSDLTTATIMFLLCSLGLIGLIFAMAVLLYRINVKTRHGRQIQSHIETIHAILEEGSGEIEEEIIISDDPPEYEAPPEYADVVKLSSDDKRSNKNITYSRSQPTRCSRCNPRHPPNLSPNQSQFKLVDGSNCKNIPSTNRNSQISNAPIPRSPPPAYNRYENSTPPRRNNIPEGISDAPGPSGLGGSENRNGSDTDLRLHFGRFSLIQFENVRSPASRKVGSGRSRKLIERIRRLLLQEDKDELKYFSDSELDSLMQYFYDGASSKISRSFSSDDIVSCL